jgi:succinate dehydrogenase / fumarate reductase, membrane anchor subunit
MGFKPARNYRTPLSRARGLGSARQGSHHWWRQRVSAVALIPLSLWFAVAIARLPAASAETVTAWMAAPWNTTLLLSFVGLGFFHAMLGLQTIIEDYVHSDWLKILAIVGVKLLVGLLALAGSLAILHIALRN